LRVRLVLLVAVSLALWALPFVPFAPPIQVF
jgi:hypothetical protein